MKLEYPLSPKYIPNWTVHQALRELFANALDTNAKPSFEHKDGQAFVKDNAPGIPRAFWVLGEGNHGEIGQFGEGLKMAMLVLAREKRQVVVETVGYTAIPSISYSEVYQSEILVLEFLENTRAKGTLVQISCTEEEFQVTKDLFLKISPLPFLDKKLGILGSPGKLFINGVYTCDINSLWGYNIQDKKLANRDRSILDMAGVRIYISNVIRRLHQEHLIRQFLDGANHFGRFEEFEIATLVRHPKIWRNTFYQLFGKKACLSYDIKFDNHVSQLGWSVVELPYAVRSLLINGKIAKTSYVIAKLLHKATPKKISITEKEKQALDNARAIAKDLVPAAKVRKVLVVEEFSALDNDVIGVLGLYKNGTIYIKRETLSNSSEVTGVMIHEFLHGIGYSDLTRGFENVMTQLLGKLATK